MEIISVGNCAFDHGQLVSLLSTVAPRATVRGVDSAEDAINAVQRAGDDCRLILINRVFDRTHQSGIELIQQLSEQGCTAPIMLISNYADAQQQAVAAGALPGFGKSQMQDPKVAERLRDVLVASAPHDTAADESRT